MQIGYFDVTYTNTGTLGIGDKGSGGTGTLYLAEDVEFNGGGTVRGGAAPRRHSERPGRVGVVNGDLVNVNNTIKTVSGSTGFISLGTGFDDQCGGAGNLRASFRSSPPISPMKAR